MTQTAADKRAETATVDAYLRALEANLHKLARGRRTREWLTQHIQQVDAKLPALSGVERLLAFQDRAECEADLQAFDQVDNLEALEAQFVKVAASYSERAGISYKAWREVGVPVAVLNQAGVAR